MKLRLAKVMFCCLVLANVFNSFLPVAFSQTASPSADTSFGVARYVDIPGTNVTDGSIVSLSRTGYVLTNNEYDGGMVGIVSLNPGVEFKVEGAGTYPLISQGTVYVNVSTQNGTIKAGDIITSSSIPGVGMKATESGYVLGISLQDFSSNNKAEVRKIPVSLTIHFVVPKANISTNFLDIFRLSAIALYERPTVVFRYFLAGMLVLASIIFGFISFGRIAGKSIEALGRNPLAGKSIQLGIFLNLLITIVLILAGLAIAYFVLTL